MIKVTAFIQIFINNIGEEKDRSFSSLRSRKEENRESLYDGSMAVPISRDWTVQQTLKAYPQTVRVFIRLKTDCVGCWLERFCALEDVSSHYGIPMDVLLDSLRSYASSIYPEEEER